MKTDLHYLEINCMLDLEVVLRPGPLRPFLTHCGLLYDSNRSYSFQGSCVQYPANLSLHQETLPNSLE